MQFNFNFEAFEKSGKDKNEAIKYLKGLNSSLDFDKLESDLKGDTEAIYNTLKGGNFSFSKPSIEDTREKLLKNKENEALKAEFNAGLSWLSEEKKQDYNFYDFKKAKERANSKQGLIKADLEAKEKELKRKEALLEKRLENENIFTKSLRDTADNLGLNAAADVLELGLNKLGFKDENYIFESEKEDIKNRALKSVREKLERGDLDFNEREKYALRAKYDELDYKKALEKEKEKLRLIQKDSGYHKSEVEFMEEELGFFHTLFNDDKDTIREFKDAYKSEGIIGADVQKAINVLKQFEESELLRHVFSDKKQELQQEYLKNALVIAELNGFDDVGLSKENELYFIKKDKDKEQKYLVNTGFLDNFWDLMENSKFEIAGGIAGGIKGFNSGKSAKGKAIKSILGAAAGSFGGGLMDAKIADMYLNRESDYERNLEYALQAGLLSLAGDGVIIAAKPMVKGVAKGAKGLYTYAKEHTPLGLFSTIPSQNINAANKIIDEVFSPEMKEDLKQAQKDFGGGVRAQDLANPVFEKLKESFAKKYGQEDKKTKSVEKLAEIFNQNSLKTKQQEMLDLIRSDKDGSTLAYLLEVAKDDVKIQNNLKNMLNLASANVEKNLKNLNINPREIKSILDEFEAGNKAAFKEVENQIAKLYNEDIRVVLDRNAYENIKEDFLQNGVNLDEMTPFLRDLENNVFSKEGVSFAKLNNFRKNLNYYIFNKDKTPNFINTLKKIAETSLKAEIDKGIDNIFKELPKAYESIKELYSTSLKDYAAMKELNESIKNLKLQDSAKSADEVVDSLIKYAKGQGEGGENNLQKIKAYLGEENNAFLEMQILNRLFKESMVENDRAKVRVFDSESFLNRVKELVGGNELYERKLGKEFLEQLSPSPVPKQLSIDEFLNTLENFKNKENFLKHIEKDPKRKDYLNLIEPTLKEPDLAFKKLENGVEKEKFIKKFSDGKDFFYLLATKDNKETILTAFKTDRINTILKEFNADIIPTFIRQGSKGKAAGTTAESITQPLFKSKEAREFLELVEGFDKLYKNDAIIAKNFTQGTASKLSTSIATSAEGAIKQKVVKGGFDPIFRLLPDGVLFGLFSKQIQGGALRYHLKKALSRSLNYDDFKLKLERELKRTNFNSNTSRLIEKLMQNLEDFNAEKEAKLAQIREVKRAQELEELKRLNQIKTAQENAYHTQEANLGQDILEAELKEDFGINFEGFKGKEAVLKLLEEKRGQVKGAFYKEGLGEIDLVWGDENFGLRHILNRHGGEFENLARELSEAVENGKIVKDDKGRLRLEYENKIVGIKDNWKGEKTNHWVVTAYVKKEKEASLYASTSFTKGEALPLNSKQSIAQKAKSENALPLNDEPLEVEIIEEASFNEPMKFLEFQQKKLLTYIKQNTPLRLLEHKIELKTRDILNFLEQSALNGKEKAFLMRHLERDLDKIEAKIKEKESVKESEKVLESDLLDKTKPLRKAEKEELTKEVLEQVQKENLKLYLNHTNENLTHFLKLEKPLKITMRGANIKHILNRHGENSTLAKNGQPFVSLEDIKNYDEYINNADKQILKENDKGEKTLLSGKQINGYYIVISSVRLKNGELKLKTMYKENGSLENNEAFKGVKLPSETPSVLQGQSLTTNLDGYPSHAEDIIAQKTKSENTQDFKPFNDAMKELYGKYESLNTYNKIEGQVKMKLLQDEIKPQIARHFKGIITKLKQGENKDKMLRVLKENREELSDYLAFNIAVRKDINIDGYGEGRFDFYDKFIQAFAKLRENKRVNEIDEDSNYRALAALVNLRDKNTALHFSFSDLNGKSEGFKSYPRKQDLLFDDLTLGDHFKSAMLLSTKDKQLKEKLIEKLKTYIDKRLYRDFLEYKIKDLESKNPKNSFFENYENKKWDEEAFEAYKKELEDLRANERAEKLEGKIKEKESVKESEKVLESDLLDKTKPLRKAEKEELTKEVLEEAKKQNAKIWVGNLENESLADELGLDFQKGVKITMNGNALKHIENRHGVNSTLAKNGQPIVENEDYANHAKIVNEADKRKIILSEDNQKILVSGKQINGYHIIIESISTKDNELKLKTMYKENGSLENSNIFKEPVRDRISGGESLRVNPSNALDPNGSSESIAQKPQQKALNLQEIEQALKARISQINDEILAIERTFEDKAFREKLKEASKVKPVLEALKKEWKALEPFIVTWTHTDYSKFKPKKYYNRKPNLSNLWHIEETLDVYKGYARENERQAKQVEREIALLEKYVKLLKDKEAEVKKLETDKKALLTESYIIPVYNKLREAFKNGQHTTKQILEAKNIDIKRDSFIAKGIINEIAQLRQYLEQFFNITPLKEFGTNYAEFYKDGKGAVEKLLAEKRGQVSGAFYKEGLGEIDLVWGDENFGLRHILERRTQDFINQGFKQNEAQNKTKELLNEIPQILENGKIYSQNKDKIEIITDKYTLAIGTRNEKKFIITELIDRRNKKRMEAMQTVVGDSFTDEPLAKTPLSSNHKQSITKKEQEIKPLGAKGWAKFKIDKEQFDELVKDLELKSENRLKIRAKLDEFIKDRGDLYIYDANYNLNLDPDKLNDVDILRLGIKSYKNLHPKFILEDMKEWKKNNFRDLINAMDEKGYLLRLGKRLYEILIEKRKDLQAIFNKYDEGIDGKAKVNAFLRELMDAFNNKNVGKVGYKREKELKSFINKTYAVDKAMVSDVAVERAKRLAEKAFNKTQSKDYIDNLKKWSEGAKYTLADDGLPYMDKKGFYYNDKGLIGNEDYENSLKGYKNFTEFISDLMEDKSGDNQLKDYFLKHRKHAFNEGSFNEKSENIYYSNPHLGAGLVGGTLNGLETDEEGNITGFDPAKFAMGFLGGSLGSKAVGVGFKHLEKNPALKEKIITELADTLAQGFDKAREKYPLLSMLEPRYIIQNEKGRKIQAKAMLKELEKEQKGLYNVVYNGKNASLIKQDLESVESAIALMQGTRYKGAKHERIKHLTDPSKEGYVTDLEFVSLGKSIREFLKNYEPFIDKNGARLYEWEKEGVRFRVVVNDVADMDSNPTTATEEIITFYSDRNLKEAMNFKNPVLKVQEKFKFNPQKAKDLLEWHKNSHALTKDENNLPKVFYHGTWQKVFDPLQNKDVNFEVFKTTLSNQDEDFLKGHYFSSNIKIAKTYNKYNIYKVFLNAKNPLVIDFKGHTFNDYIDEAIDNIPKSVQENIRDFYDSIIFKNIIDDSTQNGKKHPVADTIMVFDSNQIKHINNKGSYTDTKGNITKNKPKNSEAERKYFNENSENIYYSNPHLGAGLVGGTLNGLETDEEGNITGFDPAKFAMGFLGGSLGSKAVGVGFKHLEKNPALKEKIITELADTLAQGFDKAREKYPLLSLLEPRYIVQNERGRKIQAKVMLKNLLKLAEKESQKMKLKSHKTLKKYNVDNLEIAKEQEYRDFIANVWDKKNYEKAPNILKIAKLAPKLKKALGLEFDEVFLTKKDLSHFRTARKANYNQALSEVEMLEIPSVITHAKNAYIDTRHKNFFIVFADKKDNAKINFIHFNADELGNYIITTKKADKKVLNDKHYKQVGSGIEPHIP